MVNLSFWYAANATETGVTNRVNFTFGNFKGSVLDQSSNSTAWLEYTQQVNLGTTGFATLSFAAAGKADGYGGYIDKVSVTAVPEPETYVMLLAGLGLMGAVARRRNKGKSDRSSSVHQTKLMSALKSFR